MKKAIVPLFLVMMLLSSSAFAKGQVTTDIKADPIPKPFFAIETNPERRRWEASPEGIAYKKWETSAAGIKVLADAARLRIPIRDSANMEAVITSLSLPAESRLGFGVMARINGVEYILSFGLETGSEFRQLRSLKVNDKITLKSRGVSWAPKYAYPILSGDYVERQQKVLYKRPPRKGGC